MTEASDRFRRAMDLFDEVCDLDASQRGARLRQLCGDDEELQRDVESLLQADGAEHELVQAAESGRSLEMLADGFESDPENQPAMPQELGGYRIIREIGRGGMGIIYEAEQEAPHRRVALKVLRSGLIDRGLLKRFHHEEYVLGQLRHPSIAQIFGAGLADTPQGRQPFFVMELIAGEPLDRYAEINALDTRQRLELLARVCDGIQHAHQKGIIHRDLKPSNVLVESGPGTTAITTETHAGRSSTRDAIGRPKILDFGIARITDADMQTVTLRTEVGQLIGTLAYMSPEQVAGDSRNIDTRCDVYALGVMLYELLAGRRPHALTALPVPEAARRIREADPPRLGTLDRRMRGDIETIVAKALEKDRERRYGSAAELAADIRRHLSNEPIEARPASTLYQLSRFARRNQGLVAGLAVAILALSVGLLLAVRSAAEARQATILAQQEGRRVKEEGERTKQALADVKLVADFQGAIIQSTNMQEMGQLILDELLTEARDQNSDLTFDAAVQTLNPASLARAVVDGSMLTKASDAAHAQFRDRPTLEADIHASLADTYFSLGMYEQSLREARSALALRREHLGDNDPDTIKMIGNVCHILNNLRRPKEAEPYAEEALRRLLATTSENDKLVLEAYYRIVFTKRGLGRTEEALALAEKLVASAERLLEPNDIMLCTYRQELAMVYLETGRYEEALAIRQTLLQTYRNLFGDDHPRTLGCWSQVANTLNRLGHLEEAEAAFAEVVTRAEKVLGDSDPRTLRVLKNLAMVQAKRRHTEAARETFQMLLDRQRKALPPDDPAIGETTQMLQNLDTVATHSADAPASEPHGS